MLHEGRVINITGFEGNLSLFQKFLGFLTVGYELLFCAIHFGLETAQPSIQVVLPKRMSNRVVVF